jgi:hypothetical protein
MVREPHRAVNVYGQSSPASPVTERALGQGATPAASRCDGSLGGVGGASLTRRTLSRRQHVEQALWPPSRPPPDLADRVPPFVRAALRPGPREGLPACQCSLRPRSAVLGLGRRHLRYAGSPRTSAPADQRRSRRDHLPPDWFTLLPVRWAAWRRGRSGRSGAVGAAALAARGAG